MCGIAGEIAFHGARADLAAVRRMTELLTDRGPDGEGIPAGGGWPWGTGA